MLAIVANGDFLKKEEIADKVEELGKKEKVKIYEDFKYLYEDRDDIEVIFNSIKLPQDRIKDFKNLKWVFSYSAGVDTYPQKELKEMGVVLTNTSGIHSTNIAEQVLGAMILFSRNFIEAIENRKRKSFEYYSIDELTGRRLLIVGTGAIGREIARKASAFDMEIEGIRNRSSEELPFFSKIHTMDNIEEIIGDFDYIVSILPSTEKTKGIFNESLISLMSTNAVLINVGRGDAVVEKDLVKALKGNKIRGAYLDVFEKEPLDEDSALWDIKNLFITPHIAGPTPHYLERAWKMFKDNLALFRKGSKLNNVIDYDLKY